MIRSPENIPYLLPRRRYRYMALPPGPDDLGSGVAEPDNAIHPSAGGTVDLSTVSHVVGAALLAL
jgi:hypothetical protein